MQLDTDDALAIVRKLGCESRPKGTKHSIAIVKIEGLYIGQFGVRRGSGQQGHDYIPRQIHVSMHEAKQLADCSMSREDYIRLLREKGQLHG